MSPILSHLIRVTAELTEMLNTVVVQTRPLVDNNATVPLTGLQCSH